MRIRPVLVLIALAATATLSLAADPRITEKIPANGSAHVTSCGPFGIRFSGTVTSAIDDMIRVQGDRTGLHTEGLFEIVDDSLLFRPLLPFAAGEMVEILVSNDLEINDAPLPHGEVWRCRIAEDVDPLGNEVLWEPAGGDIEHDIWFPWSIDLGLSGTVDELIDYAWGDVDGDGVQELFLLLRYRSDPAYRLVKIDKLDSAPNALWGVVDPGTVVLPDNPIAIACGNIDDDQAAELVVLTIRRELWVWRALGGDGDPIPGTYDHYDNWSGGEWFDDVQLGDLDADGYLDVVGILQRGEGARTSLNYGTSDPGRFAPPAAFSPPRGGDKNVNTGTRATLADFDGDGYLDLAFALDLEPWRVEFLRGVGNGSFTTSPTTLGAFATWPALLEPLWLIGGPPPANRWERATLFTGLPHRADVTPDLNLRRYEFDAALAPALAASFEALDFAGLTGDVHVINARAEESGSSTSAELLYVRADVLHLRELTPGGAVVTWPLVGDYAGSRVIGAGDLDLDLWDSDLVLFSPQTSQLHILSLRDGVDLGPPLPDGIADGDTVRFGLREANCPDHAGSTAVIIRNSGPYSARIASATLEDGLVFSVGALSASEFGSGCYSTVDDSVVVTFAPADTLVYHDRLTVDIVWLGRGAAGADTTVTYNFPLLGEGGAFMAEDLGTDFLDLTWSAATGYDLQGDLVDLGWVLALPGVESSRHTLRLRNDGDFDLTARATQEYSYPFLRDRDPRTPVDLDPDETGSWQVWAQVSPSSIPAGQDSVVFERAMDWTLAPSGTTEPYCFTATAAPETLRVVAWAAIHCIQPDSGCTGVPDPCTTADIVYSCEGLPLDYCLNLSGWRWPGADPQVTVAGLPAWLTWSHVDSTVTFTSASVQPGVTVVEIAVRDAVHPDLIFDDFTLTLDINPIVDIDDLVASSGWYDGTSCDCGDLDPADLEWCLAADTTGVAEFALTAPAGCEASFTVNAPAGSPFVPGWITWGRSATDTTRAVLTVQPDIEFTGCDPLLDAIITLQIRDPRCSVVDTEEVRVRIIPPLPDLEVIALEFRETLPGDGFYQHRPFLAVATVRTRWIEVDGARVILTPPPGWTCAISPADTTVDLVPGADPVEIPFVVESCDMCGPGDFTASIAGPEGLDSDPSNNSLAATADVGCNTLPQIEFTDVTLDPVDQDLGACDASGSCNDLPDLPDLCVQAGHGVSVTARAVDADGDPAKVLSVALPAGYADDDAVITFSADSTTVVATLLPTADLNGDQPCLDLGNLGFVAATRRDVTQQSSRSVAGHVSAFWPDLEVVDLELVAPSGDDRVYEHHGFAARITVRVGTLPVTDALLRLTSSGCGFDDSRTLSLVPGVDQIVSFAVPGCAGCGDALAFTAGIIDPAFPLRDAEPANNQLTRDFAIGCNTPPQIVYSNLVLDPPDQVFPSCGAEFDCNDLDALAYLCVREGANLRLVAEVVDAESDTVRLAIDVPTSAPWVIMTPSADSTRYDIELPAPSDLATDDACVDVGTLELRATETGLHADPLVTQGALGMHVERYWPDIRVTAVEFDPTSPRENRDFDVRVTVVADVLPVDEVRVQLTSTGCGFAEETTVSLDQMGVPRDLIFSIPGCDDCGDLAFTADAHDVVMPARDAIPSNNTRTVTRNVACDTPPQILFGPSFTDTPEGELGECEPDDDCNRLPDLVALCIREQGRLELPVRAVDDDGDPIVLRAIAPEPTWATVTMAGGDGGDIVVGPPLDVTGGQACRGFGEFRFTAISGGARPDSVTATVGLWVSAYWPDLVAEFVDAPQRLILLEPVSVRGRVVCNGAPSTPFDAVLSVTDPRGLAAVESDTRTQVTLNEDGILSLGPLDFTPEIIGDYELRLTIDASNDLDLANNVAILRLRTQSGDLTVFPNVSTPNDDGINDEVHFLLDNQVVSNPRLCIFTIGGKKVFESGTVDALKRLSWNGKDDDGDVVPPGSYLYVLFDGDSKVATGTLGVVR